MYSIDDITIAEYLGLVDSSPYDIFIDTLEATNSFAGKRSLLSRLTYDEVEVIKMVFSSPPLVNDLKDVFCLCYNLRGDMNRSADDQFYSTSVFDLFRAKRYMQEFITTLIEREIKTFTSIPSDASIVVNEAKRLAPFSHSLSKIRLAEQFGNTPSEVGKWNYNYVFSLLASNKVYNDIQREKAELK